MVITGGNINYTAKIFVCGGITVLAAYRRRICITCIFSVGKRVGELILIVLLACAHLTILIASPGENILIIIVVLVRFIEAVYYCCGMVFTCCKFNSVQYINILIICVCLCIIVTRIAAGCSSLSRLTINNSYRCSDILTFADKIFVNSIAELTVIVSAPGIDTVYSSLLHCRGCCFFLFLIVV